jgi:hypothetical protein
MESQVYVKLFLQEKSCVSRPIKSDSHTEPARSAVNDDSLLWCMPDRPDLIMGRSCHQDGRYRVVPPHETFTFDELSEVLHLPSTLISIPYVDTLSTLASDVRRMLFLWYIGWRKGKWLKNNSKLNGSTDLNETHMNCVGHKYVRVQNYLFSSVDLLHRKIFSFWIYKTYIVTFILPAL